MLRTGLKIFVIIAGLAAIILAYFYFLERSKNVSNVYDLFADKGILIRINKPKAFADGISRLELLKNPNVKDSLFLHTLINLSELNQNEKLKERYLFFMPEDTIQPQMIIGNYTLRHARSVLSYLKNTFYKESIIRKKQDSGYIFYSVSHTGIPNIYFAEKDGLIFIAPARKQLFKSIDIADKGYAKVSRDKIVKTANTKVAANLFINNQALRQQYKQSILKLPDTSLFKLNQLVWDIYLKSDKLFFSGLSEPMKGSLGHFIATRSGVNFNLPGIIPEKSSFVIQFTADQLLSAFESQYKPEAIYYQWLKNSMNNKVVFFKTPDGVALGLQFKGNTVAESALKKYNDKIDTKTTIQSYRFDDQTSFDILKGSFQWINEYLPKVIHNTTNFKYATAAGKYFVFATDNSLIKQICRNSILQQNLKSSYQFQKHSTHLSSASNLFAYGDFYEKTLSAYLQKNFNDALKQIGVFEQFESYAWQMSGSGENLYNHLIFFSAAKQFQAQNIRWKTKLKSSASLKPVIVKNHNNGIDEIFVQDESNFIYLISRKGRILWRRKLQAPIISKVYQVDKYKNNKLQYLFNTEKKIYLIDRNGNDVERFPINLSEEASAGLSVFDYENNKNYRIFIPLMDKQVRLYDIDANIIPGWNFDKTDAIVNQPVQHFRFGGKDYLVFADTIRYYILNRRGVFRVKPNEFVGKSINNKIYFDQRNARWVSTTTKGNVHYIGITGEVSNKNVDDLSPGHHFMYEDITRDGRKDFIFVDEKQLRVFDHAMKMRFKYTFRNKITEPPGFYVFSRNKAGIGVVDKEEGKVYMFNRNGKQFKGYPYPGITPFTISYLDGFSGFQLIVGNIDGFLYNYQLP